VTVAPQLDVVDGLRGAHRLHVSQCVRSRFSFADRRVEGKHESVIEGPSRRITVEPIADPAPPEQIPRPEPEPVPVREREPVREPATVRP
jgi:hypothetical protein